jgi:hypothetical protein
MACDKCCNSCFKQLNDNSCHECDKLKDTISKFETFKKTNKAKRRSKQEIEQGRLEYIIEGKKLLESGEITHTNWNTNTYSYYTTVMVNGKRYDYSSSSLEFAEQASKLAKKIQSANVDVNKSFTENMPRYAPYEMFKENGWVKYKNTSFYFHPDYDYYKNGNIKKRNNKNKVSKKGGTSFGDVAFDNDVSYIKFIDAMYEALKGEIPEGHSVILINESEPIRLSNIEITKLVCNYKECSNPITNFCGRKYCSDLCKQRANPGNAKCHTDIRRYLADKTKRWKCGVDDALLVAKDRTCNICGLTNLNLRNSEPHDPRKLVIDCIQRNEGESRRDAHRAGNIQCLCFMCNMMKNDVSFDVFGNLISFLKNDSDLDLSNIKFQRVGETTRGGLHLSRYVQMIRKHDSSSKDHWLILSELYQQQNGMDAVFHKFPILFIEEKRTIFNCSVDQITPGNHLDGFQLMPVFMNYAKITNSIDEMKSEFTARGWLLPEHNKRVILPEDYYETSYIVQNMGKSGFERRKLAKGNNGIQHTQERKNNISKAKKGKANLKGRRKMKLIATPNDKTKPILTFNHWSEAVEQWKLPEKAANNIHSCAKGKLKSAYGYKWDIETPNSD